MNGYSYKIPCEGVPQVRVAEQDCVLLKKCQLNL